MEGTMAITTVSASFIAHWPGGLGQTEREHCRALFVDLLGLVEQSTSQ